MSRAAQKRSRREAQTQCGAHTSPSAARQFLLFSALLAIVTLALYYPVSGHPFLNYDDDIYLLHNPQVRNGLTWQTVGWAFTSFYASNWHPVTWISHALDCQIFGLDPAGHHEMNLLLHLINVLLLFWVLWRATISVGRSAMVAALFAVHPINVESVAWIAERKNLLSMMFFLLALGAYRWYARRPHLPRYLLVAALYAVALMAKPQVITLPFVLLLWDYWPLERMYTPGSSAEQSDSDRGMERLSWLILEKVPLLALSVASAVVTMRAQYVAGAMSGAHWQPFPLRAENAVLAYPRYVGRLLWPSQLSLIYPHPGSLIRLWQVLLALGILLAITALAVAQRRSRRYLLVGWLWFLGTLVPMVGLVQVGIQAMADRYAYLPFLGLFIMLCWGAGDWATERRVATQWQATVGAAVVLALAVVNHHQLAYWKDNVTLWTRVVEQQASHPNPDNWVAENDLGHALLSAGQEEQAIEHFRRAAAINPADADSNLNLGAYQQEHKNLAPAIAQYQKVLAITQDNIRLTEPLRAKAFRNLGFAHRDLRDYPQARESFQHAVNLNPNDGEAWMQIGILAYKLGDFGAAVQAYTTALHLERSDWGYLLLARALGEAGRPDEAQAAVQTASEMSRNLQQAQKAAHDALAP